ncbi:MAG TPA: hypothetical protein VLE97_11225 [Gaiellaceae bacterium]|nr:hypothetical protein [Gaiellaceae bacterium]
MAKAKTTKPDATPIPDDPTPEERLHTIRSILRHKIDTSGAVIASLSKDLADPDRRPLETLAWSSRAFEAAGVLQVAQEISQRLDTGESIVDVHANIQREALRSARSASSSTSLASNFAATCRTMALAEFEELLRYDAKKLEQAPTKKTEA